MRESFQQSIASGRVVRESGFEYFDEGGSLSARIASRERWGRAGFE